MRNQLLTVWGVLLIAAATLPGAENRRTPDGHPDFSGMYDIATQTPLNRPVSLGERLSLTDDEAKAVAKAAAAQWAKLNQASDPNRQAPPVGGDGVETYGAGSVGGYNWLWVDNGKSAFKIDGQWRTSIIIDPKNGRLPETTPVARKRAMERGRMNRPNRGDAWWIKENVTPGPYDDPEQRAISERCLLGFGSSAGPPALPVLYNNVKEIVQAKDTVMILNEMVHDVRIVRMNANHDPPEIRRWVAIRSAIGTATHW